MPKEKGLSTERRENGVLKTILLEPCITYYRLADEVARANDDVARANEKVALRDCHKIENGNKRA